MNEAVRYDRTTIILHWTTAAITLYMFASPYIWRLFERRTPPRLEIQFFHFSFGLLLGAIVVGRILWRINYGRRLAAPSRSRTYAVAKAVHYTLYVLLLTQISFGIWLRFAQNNPLVFFGLFEVGVPFDGPREYRHVLALIHYLLAWTIISLASVHALAALFHHYVLKDRLLTRVSFGPK
jgi:cytochrome b561